jgi:hypothetical protein
MVHLAARIFYRLKDLTLESILFAVTETLVRFSTSLQREDIQS